MGVFKVIVDVEKCIGAGHCVLRAPRIFDQREDGIVILLDDSPAPELREAAHKAADLCPSQAITIEELPSAPGRPKRESPPLGGTARSAKGSQ